MHDPLSRSRLARAIRTALFGFSLCAGSAHSAEALIELTSLDGRNGLRVDGVAGGDRTARAVASAGDVNADGIGDIIVGAFRASPGGRPAAGAAYVVFGRASGHPAALPLDDLDGSNGFRIDGAAVGDGLGVAVATAGDIDGAGSDDRIGGARAAGATLAGAAYVVFGRNSNFPAVLSASQLDGSQGFRLQTAQPAAALGTSVRGIGDFNGDGRADFAIGATGLERGNGSVSGGAFVVFGREQFPANVNLDALAPGEGFRLNGVANEDAAGETIASGDVNGDGLSDLLVSASSADPSNRAEAGSTYVLFGRASAPTMIDLAALDGSNGFRIDGGQAGDFSSFGLAALDIDGDSIDDIAIGSAYADSNGLPDTGSVHLVLGRPGSRPATLDLAAAGVGARIGGAAAGHLAGLSVADGGDVDGDGCNDLLIGAPGAGMPETSGRAYVLFGCAPLPADFSLSGIDGDNGFALEGADAGNYAGISVASAGDHDDDGVGDVLVGAHFASTAGQIENGAAYVLFGGEPRLFADGFEEPPVSTGPH
ncbi:MAG: FG-GAP repeat protein [Xanthomonadales bacterium]|nr:FG-GAP repeat protein [Xanthomonadales bacterium]